MNSCPNKSRGIALLTVLLVVSIATIFAVSFIKRQWIDIRKTQNTQRMEQSWLYAQGVDAWALGRLQDDLKKNKVDSEHDDWNHPIEPTDIEGGQISAKITDYQGRFNINNLLATKEAGIKYQERFRRLLNVLDLPQKLLEPLLDWIDADSDIHYPSGAEESHYMAKTPPYRPANQAIADISELKLIEGFTDEVYTVLEPHVSALPGIVAINVNTATEPVLQSLGKDIEQQDAQYIIDSRAENPFDGIESFIQHQALAGRTIVAEGLSISSQYFTVDSDIKMDYLQLGYRSIIFREDEDKIRVIRHVKRGFFSE
jgi:general secretion pathway protein K